MNMQKPANAASVIKRKTAAHLLAFLASIFLLTSHAQSVDEHHFGVKGGELWIGATTTLRDAGFFAHILPAFEKASGSKTRLVALSTGQILHSAKSGNLDLLITHHPAGERAFVRAGYGEKRIALMSSRYVLIGPKDDPVKIRGLEIGEALARLSRSPHPFITRADESGTAHKEAELLRAYAVPSNPEWRIATGQGMGASLNIANAKGAYIFAERASFLAHQNRQSLAILIDEMGEELHNRYSITSLNRVTFSGRNHELATLFIEWIKGPEGQNLIREFHIGGEQVFTPHPQ